MSFSAHRALHRRQGPRPAYQARLDARRESWEHEDRTTGKANKHQDMLHQGMIEPKVTLHHAHTMGETWQGGKLSLQIREVGDISHREQQEFRRDIADAESENVHRTKPDIV